MTSIGNVADMSSAMLKVTTPVPLATAGQGVPTGFWATDFWTIVLIVVTAASAAFVAAQAWYTRQALKAGDKVYSDAQRGRMDDEMPRLSLRLEERGGITLWVYANNNNVRLDPARHFQLPAEGDERILAQVNVYVVNDGPRQADLEILREVGDSPSKAWLSVPANEARTLTIQWTQSVKLWVDLARRFSAARSSDAPFPTERLATVTYRFPGDIGADETHELRMAGSALLTHTNGESWQMADTDDNVPGLQLIPQPFVRTYWLSRSESRQLG